MSDLISRQDAIDECDKQYPNIDRQDFKAVINAVPSADRPTGEWVDDGDTLICNQCGTAYNSPIFHNGWNYCPNCGAKMEEMNE